MFQIIVTVLTIFLVGCCYAKPEPIVVEDDTTVNFLLPYVVAIEEIDIGNICAGSLIRTAVVLSSAHCLVGKHHHNLRVRAGTLLVNKGGMTRGVSDSVYHRKYKVISEINFNVCLLKLDEPFPEGLKRVPTIATIDLGTEYPSAGRIARVTGWGRYNLQDGKYTTGMSSVLISIADDKYCRNLTNYELGLDPIICAGGREGAYDGDSGAPLVVNGQQVGIATGGIVGGVYGEPPQFYTNVVFFRSWIMKYANKFQWYYDDRKNE